MTKVNPRERKVGNGGGDFDERMETKKVNHSGRDSDRDDPREFKGESRGNEGKSEGSDQF